MGSILRYVGSRTLHVLVVLFAVSTILFVVLRLSGDPVAVLAGPQSTPEIRQLIRDQLGLSDPLYIQYARFLRDTSALNFGRSYQFRVPALSQVLGRLPATLELTAAAMTIVVVTAIPLGVLAAIRRGRVASYVVMALALLGQAIPTFWLGALLILVFAVQLGVLPSFGGGGVAHLLLPAVTLAAFFMAKLARLSRSGTLEVLNREYILVARSKGLSDRRVLYRHALRNMLIPLVTVIGLDLAFLMGGAVVVETVFAWPGVGRQLVAAVFARDFPVVQATAFVVAGIVVLANQAVDALHRVLDPRIRFD